MRACIVLSSPDESGRKYYSLDSSWTLLNGSHKTFSFLNSAQKALETPSKYTTHVVSLGEGRDGGAGPQLLGPWREDRFLNVLSPLEKAKSGESQGATASYLSLAKWHFFCQAQICSCAWGPHKAEGNSAGSRGTQPRRAALSNSAPAGSGPSSWGLAGFMDSQASLGQKNHHWVVRLDTGGGASDMPQARVGLYSVYCILLSTMCSCV